MQTDLVLKKVAKGSSSDRKEMIPGKNFEHQA